MSSINSNTSLSLEKLPPLLRKDKSGIAYLTLNRPKTHNSLSKGLLERMQSELDKIEKDSSVRAVIIDAVGKSFCAGHDLKELRDSNKSEVKQLFKDCSRVMTTIMQLPQPVIAKVQGLATAAGCQLVATCDMAIASENASFCTPGVNIGLFCSTPMVALSRNIPRKIAMEMLLTGNSINALKAASWGLVNDVVPDLELEGAVIEIAENLASKSQHTITIGKHAFYNQLDMSIESAYEYTSEIMTKNMLSLDAQEGINAFLGNRNPKWVDN